MCLETNETHAHQDRPRYIEFRKHVSVQAIECSQSMFEKPLNCLYTSFRLFISIIYSHQLSYDYSLITSYLGHIQIIHYTVQYNTR